MERSSMDTEIRNETISKKEMKKNQEKRLADYAEMLKESKKETKTEKE